MAEAGRAIDDALAHLDSLISRLKSEGNAAVPSDLKEEKVSPAGAAPPPKEEVAEVAGSKESNIKDKESPIPNILEGRKCAGKYFVSNSHVYDALTRYLGLVKLPGVGAVKTTSGSGNEHSENFDKALIQVGVVHSVDDHPISEKLYVCKVEVAGSEIRQVVAGLKKFVKVEELEGRKVCVILNLKPAKLAGQVSEAMILAGSIATPEGSEIVKVLEPPLDATTGDRIFVEGGAPSASPSKQLSSKIWEKIVPLLKVEGGLALFDKKSLVTSAGAVKVPGLPDGAGIH